MITKQCGNCEFWDRENTFNPVFERLVAVAQCKSHSESYAYYALKDVTTKDEGQDCPVYKEAKQ